MPLLAVCVGQGGRRRRAAAQPGGRGRGNGRVSRPGGAAGGPFGRRPAAHNGTAPPLRKPSASGLWGALGPSRGVEKLLPDRPWEGRRLCAAPLCCCGLLSDGSRLQVGSSADLRVGQAVFAIGNPMGLSKTLSGGVVSGLNRGIPTPGGGIATGAIQAWRHTPREHASGPELPESRFGNAISLRCCSQRARRRAQRGLLSPTQQQHQLTAGQPLLLSCRLQQHSD